MPSYSPHPRPEGCSCRRQLCVPGYLPCRLGLLEFRVWVPNRRQIGGPRPGVQFSEQTIVAWFCFQHCYLASGVVDVAEGYRVGWASRLAGSDNIPVAYLSTLAFGFNFGPGYPLYAVCALLHHTPAAHGHFRVPHELEA